MYGGKQMDFIKNFKTGDSFWKRYQTLVKEVVIPYQEKVLKDEVEGVEKSHAIANFKAAGEFLKTGEVKEEFYGMVFQDSDVAKWLEACAYSLYLFPDAQLETECDEVIAIVAAAQHEDGYLNTYFTVKEPDKRWTNLHEAHELYCAGHMIEAAVAYATYLGKTKLLNVMCKMADHIYRHFVIEQAPGYPGHPEVELALLRLYDYTKNENYMELALHFINVRGVDSDYYTKEKALNPWSVWGNDTKNKEYAQNYLPVREQTDAVGHAVRAVYLYTGMADAAKKTKDASLENACKNLWESITNRRMYLTGAIGSAYEGEAFTKDFHLPNDSAYAETCAAVGLIFFAKKMLGLEKKSDYANVMERALYNCVLAGMELDGTKFFYVNPLEVVPGISGSASSLPHALPKRPGWFSCACCPPNVARLLESLYTYAWDYEDGILYSHLFLDGTLDMKEELGGSIQVKTKYPYENEIVYTMQPEKEQMETTLAIRLPDWSQQTKVYLKEQELCEWNGQDLKMAELPQGIEELYEENGYLYVKGTFAKGDSIKVELELEARFNYASTKVASDTGKAAVSYGPLIYCAEGSDNEGDVLSLLFAKDSKLSVGVFLENKLGGIKEIHASGYRLINEEGLYTQKAPEALEKMITLTPYYTWGNRELNEMRVWIPQI